MKLLISQFLLNNLYRTRDFFQLMLYLLASLTAYPLIRTSHISIISIISIPENNCLNSTSLGKFLIKATHKDH